jgi:hypothetical protein
MVGPESGLLFLGGALDCTSSVVYWPWVSQYDEAFTATLATVTNNPHTAIP